MIATTVPTTLVARRIVGSRMEEWTKWMKISGLGLEWRVLGEVSFESVEIGDVSRELSALAVEENEIMEKFDIILGMDWLNSFGTLQICWAERKIRIEHIVNPNLRQNTRLWVKAKTNSRLANWQFIRRGESVNNSPIFPGA